MLHSITPGCNSMPHVIPAFSLVDRVTIDGRCKINLAKRLPPLWKGALLLLILDFVVGWPFFSQKNERWYRGPSETQSQTCSVDHWILTDNKIEKMEEPILMTSGQFLPSLKELRGNCHRYIRRCKSSYWKISFSFDEYVFWIELTHFCQIAGPSHNLFVTMFA